MKRTIAIGVFFLALLELYSVRPLAPKIHNAPQTLSGAIHVHSTFSDGGGTPEEIAQAGKEAGLDFVVLTDHNDTRARKAGLEKNYDGVDLFIEMEASIPAGHALTFFSHTSAAKLPDPRVTDMTYEHLIGQGSPKNFFIVAAHPSNIKNPWTQLDRYPDGVEIANFDSFWQRQLTESVLGFTTTVATFCLNNYLGALRFIHFFDKDLTSWDSMNAMSPGHFGILGHDTHSKLKLSQELVFRWPDYLATFALASNAVFFSEPLKPDFGDRKAHLYEALRGGHSAVVFHLIHPFAGNEWSLLCGERSYLSGDWVDANDNCHFQVVTPTEFPVRLVLMQDGKKVFEKVTQEGVERIAVTGRGVYRLEVYAEIKSLFRILLRRPVPYIFYNPIYVRSQSPE